MPGHGTGLYGEGIPALQGEWAELMGTLASSFPDLLVKSRVISQQADERSYYIFYHILTGSLSLSVKIFTSLSLSLNCFSAISNNERISCVWRGSVVLHKSV